VQVYDAVRAEFERRGAYLLNEEEKAKVGGWGLPLLRLGLPCRLTAAHSLPNKQPAGLPVAVGPTPSLHSTTHTTAARRARLLLPPPTHPQVRAKIIVGGRLNADIVGQSVQRLAEIFGISVPAWAKVLIAEVGGLVV
jgi:hypothetical protein